ncbi:MAG: GerMN domain-containing protein [Candidatus Poribacteria bacterium]|nr:GerMN domain-containing protein [Candidatus Poribacteria bacterium]
MVNNYKRGQLKLRWLLGAVVVVVLALALVLAFVYFDRPEVLPPRPPLPTAASSPDTSPPLQQIRLYFFQPESLELVDFTHELHLSNDKLERLKQIIGALLEQSPPALTNTIPKGTLLYEVYLDEQSTVYLDFSGALSAAHVGGTSAELLTVQTILKTVRANFGKDIQNVQILIEGQEVDTIAGHVDISKPLSLAAIPQEERSQSNSELQ